MIDSSSFRSRRLFLCTFIDCLALMMIFVFLFFGCFYLGLYMVCVFILRYMFLSALVSVLAVVALLSAILAKTVGFYFFFRFMQ